MNYREVLQYRVNRTSRTGRPLLVFYETFEQSWEAADSLLSGDPRLKFVPLLERSVVISIVTAIEVYFRDMLHIIFTHCNPKFFEPTLREIHPEKYNISDLIAVYRHSLHPLELVVSSQSFQNVGAIEKVFSHFVDGGFWKNVLSVRTRIKDQPEIETKLDHNDYSRFDALFSLRHQLVHNPNRRSIVTEAVTDMLDSTAGLVFAADHILNSAISANMDSEFLSKVPD